MCRVELPNIRNGAAIYPSSSRLFGCFTPGKHERDHAAVSHVASELDAGGQ